MNSTEVVNELRTLIVKAAPDPAQVVAVRDCSHDLPLDSAMPFSSIMVLGVVVAVEDRFGIVVTRDSLKTALAGGVTLSKLAGMVETLILEKTAR